MKRLYPLLTSMLLCAASALSQSSIFTMGGTFPVGAGSGTAGAGSTNPVEMIVADFNRDGRADIATIDNADRTVTVLLGDGAGGFTEAPGSPVPVTLPGAAIASGDFNGDSNPDLAITGVLGTAVLLGDVTGRFVAGRGIVPSNVVIGGTLLNVADFTGDGKPDLIVAYGTGVYLLPGDGTGAFGPFRQIELTSLSAGFMSVLLAADFNGDGKVDLADIGATYGTIDVYTGNGSGQFQGVFEAGVLEGAVAGFQRVGAVGDFNGDGKPDLLTFQFVGNTQAYLWSWTGNTSTLTSSFSSKRSSVAFTPAYFAVADFNGDGNLDWAGLAGGALEIYFGDGAGGFTAAPGSPFNVGPTSFALAAGDFNGDGKPDLAVRTTAAVQLFLNASGQPVPYTYDFPHFSLGQGWQTVLTYVNYSPQSVTCQTSFFSDGGAPLAVPFGGAAVSSRTDALPPGGEIHALTTADPSAVGGWAQGQCTGPVKASMLFRLYNAQGVALTEAGVNATTSPGTSFTTFAQTNTGLAFANPYPLTTNVTVTALDATGKQLGSTSLVLPPMGHTASNVSSWLNQSFTGSVQITSTFPAVSLSLNAEAYTPANPVISSLPPGDIGITGSTFYFPHFSLGQGWQTVLTYTNTQLVAVNCQTTFFSDSGAQMPVAFGGPPSSTRSDQMAAGGAVHSLTTADPTAQGGWAKGSCSFPVKASLLFRQYDAQGVALAEAGVNGSTTPTTKFVTFAQTGTGIALANPSINQTASVTITALDATGVARGSTTVNLPPNGHSATNVSSWLNKSFTGSVEIVSTIPIVSLSINAEAYTAAYPVISSLPPGDLDGSTALAGH